MNYMIVSICMNVNACGEWLLRCYVSINISNIIDEGMECPDNLYVTF